jgi:uncharacterized protein (DUF983 family)
VDKRHPGFWSTIGWCLALRCPRCGREKLFRGWFQMHERCGPCGLAFHREPGFYLGSIYFNYGLTALVVTLAYVILFAAGWRPATGTLAALAAYCGLFPLWFFRYARALWLGFDQYWDPQR